MFNFPLFIEIAGKQVVVIGGGKVAYRKVNKLRSASALITVVAPQLSSEMQALYQKGEIQWIKEYCRPEHLRAPFLIVSASGSKEAQKVIQQTVTSSQLVNGADCPSIGNVSFPASFEEEGVHIAVSTHGENPFLAKKVKHQLKEWFQSVKNHLL